MTAVPPTVLAPTAHPAGAHLQRGPSAPQSAAKIARAAGDFTAQAFAELLTPLFAGLPQDGGLFGGGPGEAAFRPMLVQEIAKSMAAHGGLGITTLVTQAMLRLQEKTE
jgi:Rod binding domain-containing protein